MMIKIYTTATCGFCRAEKEWLQEKGLDFQEIKADESRQAVEELFRTSHQLGVPFTVITKDNGQVEKILGFDRARLEAAVVGE